MKCFYHADMDGRCAAFWVFLSVGIKFDGTGDFLHSEFIEITYDQPFPLDKIEPNEQVWIVDYSIKPEMMEQLLKITPNVTWIDHHITAIKAYDSFPVHIRGVRKNGIAACVLTYVYLHKMTERGEGHIKPFRKKMITGIPRATKLVGDRDIWKFKFGEKTECFHLGASAYDCSPVSDFWMDCLQKKRFVNRVIKEGQVIMRYNKHTSKEYMNNYAYEIEFEGYRCIALNRGRGGQGSKYFESYRDKGYDIMILYAFNGKIWTVSLYTEKDDIDVSEIAKKYGGGGHKKAAGFRLDADKLCLISNHVI